MWPIQTQDKLFHDGNGTTELGTVVTAEWLNDVQQALLMVLAAGGQTPAKGKHNLLRDAIERIVNNHTPAASATVAGVVKLNDTLSSQSTTEALTANQGRLLNGSKLGNTGGQTLSGSLRIENSNWEKMYFPVAGGEWQIEVHPSGGTAAGTKCMSFAFAPSDGSVKTYLSFPDIGADEVVAYQRWVSAGLNGKVSNQGDEDVAGVKTFKNRQKFENRILFSSSAADWGNGYSGEIGANSLDTWIKNETSGKYLALKNDGELHYGGHKVYTAEYKPSWTNDITGKPTTLAGYGLGNAIAVLTGTIADGGTIPLPAGFTQGQCKFMVSMSEDDPTYAPWDINESGNNRHYYTKCYVTGRVVTAKVYHGSGSAMQSKWWWPGRANYLVIAYK